MSYRRSTFPLFVMVMAILAALGVFNPAHAAPVAVSSAAAPRFTVEVTGQGPDVILIPGLASSAAVWDDTVKQLKGRYRLHVIQVAGFAGAPAGANAEGPVVQPTVDALDGYRSAGLKSPAVITRWAG